MLVYQITAIGEEISLFGELAVDLGQSSFFTIVGAEPPVVNLAATGSWSNVVLQWNFPAGNNTNTEAIQNVDDETFSVYLLATSGGETVQYLLEEATGVAQTTANYATPKGLVADASYSVMITFTTYARQSLCQSPQLYSTGNTVIAPLSFTGTNPSSVTFIHQQPFYEAMVDMTSTSPLSIVLAHQPGPRAVEIEFVNAKNTATVFGRLLNLTLSGNSSTTFSTVPSSWGAQAGEMAAFRVIDSSSGAVLAVSPAFYLESNRVGFQNLSCLGSQGVCASSMIACAGSNSNASKYLALDMCRVNVAASSTSSQTRQRSVSTYCRFSATKPSIPAQSYCTRMAATCRTECVGINGVLDCDIISTLTGFSLVGVCICPYGAIDLGIAFLIAIGIAILIGVIGALSSFVHKYRIEKAQKKAARYAEDAQKQNKGYLSLETPNHGRGAATTARQTVDDL